MDNFCQFKKHVTAHFLNVSDEQFRTFQEQSKTGKCLTPNFEIYRGHGERVSREAFIDIAISVNGIRPENYFGVLDNEPVEIIGMLEEPTRNGESTPVCFYPGKGIYAMAGSETRVYDMWLSWPCYPQNW